MTEVKYIKKQRYILLLNSDKLNVSFKNYKCTNMHTKLRKQKCCAASHDYSLHMRKTYTNMIIF